MTGAWEQNRVDIARRRRWHRAILAAVVGVLAAVALTSSCGGAP